MMWPSIELILNLHFFSYNMDSANMYKINLVMTIENHLKSGDEKKRSTSEVVDALVSIIAAVKRTESESISGDPIGFRVPKNGILIRLCWFIVSITR